MNPNRKDYKKPFKYSAIWAIAGSLIALFGTSQGQGLTDAAAVGLILWPLILGAFIAVPAAFIYGSLFILRTPKQVDKAIALIVLFALGLIVIYFFIRTTAPQ